MGDQKEVAKAPISTEGAPKATTGQVSEAQAQLNGVVANLEALASMNVPPDESLVARKATLQKRVDKEKSEQRYAKLKEVGYKAVEMAIANVGLEEDVQGVNLVFNIGRDDKTGKAIIASCRIGGARKPSTGGGGDGGAFGGKGVTLDGVHYSSGKQALDAFKAGNPDYAGKYEGSVNAHKILEGLAEAGKCTYVRDEKVEAEAKA